jgi:PatG Domain
MEQAEMIVSAPIQPANSEQQTLSSSSQSHATLTPQQGCATCGAAADARASEAANPSFVYAIGQIEARFPRLSAEKEFAQVTRGVNNANKPSQQVFQEVLSKRENRYLLRHLCWVLTIQGMETYLLVPRDPADIDLLVEAIRPAPSPLDIDVVIGMRGPIAPPTMCNGLMVPIVAFDQIYSFAGAELIKTIPRPEKITAEHFGSAAKDLFSTIMRMTDNAGNTDEHRALNYLAMRYPAIYAKAAEELARDRRLTSIDVRPSPRAGTRKIVDVIFSFSNGEDYTEKSYVQVDVAEEFPFLQSKFAPYYNVEIGGMR